MQIDTISDVLEYAASWRDYSSYRARMNAQADDMETCLNIIRDDEKASRWRAMVRLLRHLATASVPPSNITITEASDIAYGIRRMA